MRNTAKFALTAALILSFVTLFSVSSENAGEELSLARISSTAASDPGKSGGVAATGNKTTEAYGKLPLHFEPNRGQTDERVEFFARGNGYGIFLQDTSATLVLSRAKDGAEPGSGSETAVLRMGLVAAGAADAVPEDRFASRTNYFIGNDPSKWQADVPNYGKVRFANVYDGVDVVYYGNQRRLEYDFIVAPNADPKQIRLDFEGARSLSVDRDSGDLVLGTALGDVRQHKPVAYQEIDGDRREVAAAYEISGRQGESEVSIRLGDYDNSHALVIDPILAYASYLGGNKSDFGTAIAVDAEGSAYVTGYTISTTFPVTAGALKTALLPIASTVYGFDAFVTKINPAGTEFVYSTYLGTNAGSDYGYGIAVDGGGNAFVTGATDHPSFPIVNAQQPTFGGNGDAFVAKLNPTGSALSFSTFYGGSGGDNGQKIRLANGEIYVTGSTTSSNFPTTAGVLKPATCAGAGCPLAASDAFVASFSTGGTVAWATLLGGGNAEFAHGLAIDSVGNTFVGGYTLSTDFPVTSGAFQTVYGGGTDGFVAKLNANATALEYATYLGGGLQSDRVWAIDIDADGNAYAAGQTENSGFPTTPGAFDTTFNNSSDAFLTKLNPAGTGLVFSTFFGGTGADKAFAVKVSGNGEALIAGETGSANLNFPLRRSLQGNLGTLFLTRFNAAGNDLVFSSLLGTGGAKDIALDASDNAYLTGEAHYVTTTQNAPQTTRGNPSTSTIPDGFVMKIGATDENLAVFTIAGAVSDVGTPGGETVVTLSGTVNRSVVLNASRQYAFGGLPAGGNYTVSARRTGYLTTPESAVFNNLQANQFADFTIVPNSPPVGVITSPAHGTTYNAPANVTIQANASDPDGHAIQKVDFVAYSSETGNVPLGTDTTAPYEFTWTNVPVGTWALYAIPTDEIGLRGTSESVVHIFVIDATTPSVQITSPLEGQQFAEGDYVPLGAQVSSSIVLVEWYDQNNTLIGRRFGGPWTTTWRVMVPGNYTITAKGFTSQNVQTTSSPVNIIVNPINHRITGRIINSLNSSGIANVPLNLTSPSNPGITANTTTDANGEFLFTNLGTTPNDSVIITPVLASYTLDPPTRGIGFLGYIEWPNQSFVATPETQITVSMTSPTNGQIFTAPATVDLAAAASSGAGTITKVEFYRSLAQNTLLGTDTTAPFEFQLTDVPAGSYTYFARAYDSTGAISDSTGVRVTVNAQPAAVRIVGVITSPGGGWMPGIPVRLTGTANGNPVDQTSYSGAFGTYGFYALPSGGNYTVTPQPAGSMTFTPESQTFSSLTIDNDNVDFVSSAPNQPPGVVLGSPSDGSTYNLPTPIPISATATDTDGTINHLRITAVGNSFSTTIGETNTGTISLNWVPNLPGEYTISATARDNGGLQRTTSVNITVTNNTPVSVSGRIVDRGSIGIEGVTVELKNFQETATIASATTDANGNYLIPGIATFNSYVLRAAKINYTFSPQKRTYFNLATSQTNADYTGTLQLARSEFDGDGISDLAVWRPTSGVWYVDRSSDGGTNALQFGGDAFGDVAVPGNFDGDQKTDYAVYRNGTWYVRQSSDGQVRVVQFGIAGDTPVSGDFDGDGKTDLAVWRPVSGVWHLLRSGDGGYETRQFGLDGDTPLCGDFDGDGKADLAIWRSSTGTWYIRQSSDGAYRTERFGIGGDVPIVGDFDGDKLADYAVFRPSSGVWYAALSATGGVSIRQWGATGDIPVPGDYDRDGKTDFGVFRRRVTGT